MLRLVFLLPVLCFVGVSATFNVLFSLTLSSGPERWAWVALGIGAAVYSGLALDICRVNFSRGAPSKGIVALIFLLPALAWDARCTYGFASFEQERARQHVADATRKRAIAENHVRTARKALNTYADAIEPIAADAAVKVLAQRTNEERCAQYRMLNSAREICDQLTKARIDAERAHAKVRLTEALQRAEAKLTRIEAPPPSDSLADLIGPETVKWLPAAVLQLGVLLGVFAASVPAKTRNPKPAAPSAPVAAVSAVPTATRTPRQASSAKQVKPASPPFEGTEALVNALVGLAQNPDQFPPGLGLDDKGWIAGPQRPLAAKLKIPVSRLNKELKAAAQLGALELDTTGGVTRIRVVHH